MLLACRYHVAHQKIRQAKRKPPGFGAMVDLSDEELEDPFQEQSVEGLVAAARPCGGDYHLKIFADNHDLCHGKEL